MNQLWGSIGLLILEIVIFLVLVVMGTFIYKRVINSDKLSNFKGLFPEDEMHTLKQVFYLIIMALAFVDLLYSLMVTNENVVYFIIFDIILSLFLAITMDKSSLKGKAIVLLLVPFDSINRLFFNFILVSSIDIIHVLVFIYFVKVYYDKFRQYTESHELSFTILVLFVMIFFSFIITQVVENVNPLDSLVMVSNAFTSNGYAILGNSVAGKLNSIILVWGGYVLSSVGTATLTAAILIRHFNNKFDEAEESNRELKKSITRLEELIETFNQDDDGNS